MKYFNPQTQAYLSESEIRILNPNTSFPQPFVPSPGYELIFPAPAPEYNSVTQRVVEITPQLTSKGHYEERFEIVELFSTQEEKDVAIAADTEVKRKASIPVSVKMRQARLALNSAGYLESVENNISLLPKADQIEWEFAETVLRDSPLVSKISTLLNISETQVDDLFILAGTL